MRRNHTFKYISVILAVIVALATLTLSSCTSDKDNSGTKKDESDANVTADGYTKGTATVDDVCQELFKTVLNSANSASKERLTEKNPLVSWWIDVDCDVNGHKELMSFKVNFDVTKPESMAIRLSFKPDGEDDDIIEAHFYADAPNTEEGLNPGSLYLRVGENKLIVPIVDSILSDMFPFNTVGTDDLAAFFASRLATIDKISYEYKDEIGDKRTSRYRVRIDVKKTVTNVLTLLKGTQSYDSVKWIVENLFGISVDKINSDLPVTNIEIYFVTEGGSRTTLGMGTLKELVAELRVQANGKTGSVFRGEKFNGRFELKKFTTLRKLTPMSSREDLDAEGYKLYDSRTIGIKGKLAYTDTDETYDFDLKFLYTGLNDRGEGDKLSFKLFNPEGKNTLSVYYKDNKLYVNCLDSDGTEHNLVAPFDTDAVITKIEQSISSRDKIDFLKALTYVIGSLQLGGGATEASYKFDSRFFEGLLNMNLEGIYGVLNEAYVVSGGTGNIKDKFAEAGLNLGDFVYNRAVTVTVSLKDENVISVTEGGFDLPSDPSSLSSAD